MALKVLFVFGMRPEAIKLAPVIRELRGHPGRVVCKVCVTAQHREMLDQVLRLFGVVPDYPSASSGQALRRAQDRRPERNGGQSVLHPNVQFIVQ